MIAALIDGSLSLANTRSISTVRDGDNWELTVVYQDGHTETKSWPMSPDELARETRHDVLRTFLANASPTLEDVAAAVRALIDPEAVLAPPIKEPEVKDA